MVEERWGSNVVKAAVLFIDIRVIRIKPDEGGC